MATIVANQAATLTGLFVANSANANLVRLQDFSVAEFRAAIQSTRVAVRATIRQSGSNAGQRGVDMTFATPQGIVFVAFGRKMAGNSEEYLAEMVRQGDVRIGQFRDKAKGVEFWCVYEPSEGNMGIEV